MAAGTMKRKLEWLAMVLAVSLLGFGTALLLWPRDRITAESHDMIRMGMTEKEVEDILGGPGIPYQEAAQIAGERLDLIDQARKWDSKNTKIWLGQRGVMTVEFDQGGEVKATAFAREPHFLDPLRDWLGW
jgi:hypothetical protein